MISKKKQIPKWKLEEVNHLLDLLRNYETIAILDVSKISDRQIQEIRKNLRGKTVLRMSKKALQVRAIDQFKKESKKVGVEELAKKIPGQSTLLFTNMDVLEIKKTFEDHKWMIPAKPEEITPVDIWVPEGDTALPTGQVISELNMILKLSTMIKNDTIWVRETKMTHKAGDIVSVKEAAILKKLGVKPIESVIKIHFAWSNGKIIPADVLYMNMEQFLKEFASCYISAQSLAIELGVIDNEIITPLMQKAQREAIALLFESKIFTEEMLEEYIRKAVSSAMAVNAEVFGESMSNSK